MIQQVKEFTLIDNKDWLIRDTPSVIDKLITAVRTSPNNALALVLINDISSIIKQNSNWLLIGGGKNKLLPFTNGDMQITLGIEKPTTYAVGVHIIF
jgi:hypothetical protein